jgi:uncharacterized protein
MTIKKASAAENLIFSMRGPIVIVFLLLTAFFAFEATNVQLSTDMKKMVPLKHEFIQNLFKHKDELSLGNDIRIAVENTQGDIFNAEFMEVLRLVTDEVFYLKGVDKSKVASLWTPNVRWVEVTEDGFRGGEVIPPTYDGSAKSLEQLQANVLRSGQVGRLVADDFRSAIVYVPLIEQTEDSSEKINYKEFSDALEEKIRQRFEKDHYKIHIVGFAKKVGDLINGAKGVVAFFIIAIAITFVLLLIDSKCIRSTVTVIVCSVIAVIWQLGILTLLGYGIDPYSMLVPFLVFAIGVSHGVQLINEFAVESSRVADRVTAARLTFRALYTPGILALVSDAIGFLTLYVIEIRVIQDLAVAACLGVFVIILTNLVLVPVFLSYVGVSKTAIHSVEKKQAGKAPFWRAISHFATGKAATVSLIIAAVGAGVGLYIGKDLKIGDLDPGAPELRPDSRYNQDDMFINTRYSVSADVLVVMVETPEEGCSKVAAMEKIDRFMWHMENVEGVESAMSLVTVSKLVITGFNEGSWKWAQLSKVQDILNNSMQNLPSGLMNVSCSLAPVIVFLNDHKAETLDRAVKAVRDFAKVEDDPEVAKFVLASGNAGVEAATNQTISRAQTTMLIWVYGVVTALCLITFRSWRAVVCVMVPLALTTVLCNALMTLLGIGVKVATLPVIALGVGIGVDYGIYIYTRLKGFMEDGLSLDEAYFETLRVTGKAVCFTGLTLAIGVGTWIFSDIKFQADMGILLTFMFLWNMIGAIWLLPALAHFLIRNNIPRKAV